MILHIIQASPYKKRRFFISLNPACPDGIFEITGRLHGFEVMVRISVIPLQIVIYMLICDNFPALVIGIPDSGNPCIDRNSYLCEEKFSVIMKHRIEPLYVFAYPAHCITPVMVILLLPA